MKIYIGTWPGLCKWPNAFISRAFELTISQG